MYELHADILAKVRRFFHALESHDRECVEQLLAKDLVFSSPTNRRIDREVYMERCWPQNEQVRSISVERIVVEGNEAFVRYRIEQADRTLRNIDVLTFRNGLVAEIDAHFGAIESAGPSSEA